MEENEEKMVNSCKPVFTRQWLCVRVLFVTVVSLFMTLVASGFDALAFGRKEEFLLKNEVFDLLSDSIDFCFVLIFVTMMSLAYSIAVGYGYDIEEGIAFRNQSLALLKEKGYDINELPVYQIGATIGVHTGPYPLGFGIIEKGIHV